MLLCVNTYAGGKVTFGGKYFSNTDEIRPIMGLSVYEKIVKNRLYFNGWAGLGQVPNKYEETTTWKTIKANLDVPLDNWKWIVSGGASVTKTEPWNETIKAFEAKVSYKLW